MSQPGESLQLRFFQRLKEIQADNISLVNEIADTLSLSTDSAYRRMRGETSLSLDEISLLCQRFNLSLDMFNSMEEGSVLFSYSSLHTMNDFKKYLLTIFNHMQLISKSKNKHMWYAAVDIPIFHYFKYHELTAFKFFYWLKAVVNEPLFLEKKYESNIIDSEIIELGKAIYDTYCTIPSTEIWTASTVNSFLRQIEFYWDSGLFANADDAVSICESTSKMLTSLEKQAEISLKDGGSLITGENQFSFYQSEIEIGNNCIYISIGENQYVYLSLHTFNKMTSTNQYFCNETKLWLDNLIKKSVIISGVAQKQRYRFFKQALDNTENLINKIKNGD